jgi:large subunit ribosomal protein L9
MKVILTTEVEGVGSKGDIVDVSAGYGRNYLLPKNLAIKATDGALRQAEALKRAKVEAERRALDGATATKTQLSGTRVVIAAQAGDEGQLFGSIGVTEVIEAIAKVSGVTLDRGAVSLPAPVKTIGLHEASVRLHPEVEFPLTIDVIPA